MASLGQDQIPEMMGDAGMSPALADRMRANPRGNWKIADVEAVFRDYGITCSPPRGGGSHYKVSHPSQRDILTIPARRPLKPIYIRKLIRFIDALVAGTSNGQA
jgi:predicted RNA binding protein YcfA (HicA-like mRNA interferase family)